ncbi:hypothetical protein [Ramlibacter sp.]|uniref:hypothetical protein n=1 Tax=Ramlibacter sp. TaxID=1917967 RepID=UPI003D1375AE
MTGHRATLAVASAAIAVACATLAWRHWDGANPPARPGSDTASQTSVLGSAGRGADANRPHIPAPPVPRGAAAVVIPAGDDEALAAWTHEGRPRATRYARGTGWSDTVVLEDLFGDASGLLLAGDGAGTAMAVWRHRVGRVDSLRYARYEAASGWSAPDVVAGILPAVSASQAAPATARLDVDANGNAVLRWPSAFGEAQQAEFLVGTGWSRPADVARR